jgi:hypothetical protein
VFRLHLGLAFRDGDQSAQVEPLMERVLVGFDILSFTLLLPFLDEVVLSIFLARLSNSIILEGQFRKVSEKQEVFSKLLDQILIG